MDRARGFGTIILPRLARFKPTSLACESAQKVLRSTWVYLHATHLNSNDESDPNKSIMKGEHYCLCITCLDVMKASSIYSKVKAEDISNMKPEEVDKIAKAIPCMSSATNSCRMYISRTLTFVPQCVPLWSAASCSYAWPTTIGTIRRMAAS